MKKLKIILSIAVAVFALNRGLTAQDAGTNIMAAPDAGTNSSAWLAQPLSLLNALTIALQQNPTILKAQDELTASAGVVVQTRAIALPLVQGTGRYTDNEITTLQQPPLRGYVYPQANQDWNVGVQIVQSIYQGGRLTAAVKAAKVTKQQALAQYQTALADTLLAVRLAYYDILLAAEQITVNEASVNLLQKELDDQQRRYDAGTVPHFNVLRARVSLANARPPLIKAQNNYRISKNNLCNLLGYNLPRDIWDNIPLKLTDTLDAAPFQIILPDALQTALSQRPELIALRKGSELQQLGVVNAKAGYKPNLQVFAGYNWFNQQFSTDVGSSLNGWNAGGQMTWNFFDGLLTHGRVVEAKALYAKSKTAVDEGSRNIELEVRTTYSDFLEAQQVLESQKTVLEEAEEALREANARFDAGTGTQLDVLDAENSLTQARSTNVQALHDYDAARARFQRAVGADMVQSAATK
jgi:outer membrane protein